MFLETTVWENLVPVEGTGMLWKLVNELLLAGSTPRQNQTQFEPILTVRTRKL